jgi:hypothetical protein
MQKDLLGKKAMMAQGLSYAEADNVAATGDLEKPKRATGVIFARGMITRRSAKNTLRFGRCFGRFLSALQAGIAG